MEKRVDCIVRLHKAQALLSTVYSEIKEAKTENSNFRDETVSRLEEKQDILQKNLDTAATNNLLNPKVQRLKWEHSYLAHSSEIVVGGVPLSDSAKLVALAVLKTNDPQPPDADMQEARYMVSTRGVASTTETVPKLGSILVTFSNSKVAKKLIAAKIIKKKLTTDQLFPDNGCCKADSPVKSICYQHQ